MIIAEKVAVIDSSRRIVISSNDGVFDAAVFVRGNFHQLVRILSNVLDNSIESLIKGGEIRIELIAVPKSVQVHIEDNGIGIPSNVMQKIGIRGYSYKKINGSGLGLHQAKEILHNWGGTLSVESILETGTKTIISLQTTDL